MERLEGESMRDVTKPTKKKQKKFVKKLSQRRVNKLEMIEEEKQSNEGDSNRSVNKFVAKHFNVDASSRNLLDLN